MRLHHRMLGHVGLHEAAPGDERAAGAAGHLVQELEGALGRARVGLAEAEVAVDDADRRELREVVALGHHLRADDDVGLAGLDAS